jgi:hypothetical protein
MRFLDAVLIGGWEAPAYWQVLALSKLRRVRSVAFYESTPESHRFDRGPIARARQIFFNNVDAVVVPGVAAHNGLVDMGVPRERIHTGFNAVDVRHFHEAATQHRQEHQVNGLGIDSSTLDSS